jgi:type-F conjugative transfer system pilin assembly protein TrbC
VLPALLNRALVALLAACLVGPVLAQELEAPPIAQMKGPKISPEELAQITAITELVKSNAAAAAADPKAQEEMAKVSRRIDDIANKQMAGDREKVLRFLKIDPNAGTSVYIFVSWSMPLDMLRAYALEAMWTGGYLVFRGVPPGRSLPEFFMKDVRQIIYDKGAASVINLDPRLYDTYSVNVVPTIVLTTERKNPFCANSGTKTVKTKEQNLTYQLCPKMDPSKYWKISGAVTIDYALQVFQSSGATEAGPLLEALSKAYQGTPATRAQKPFSGAWKDAPTPEKFDDSPSTPPKP